MLPEAALARPTFVSLFLLAPILAVASCAGDGPTDLGDPTTEFVTIPLYYGEFALPAEGGVVDSATFSIRGFGGPFVFRLVNSSVGKALSGTVTLNGEQIAGPADFAAGAGPKELELQLTDPSRIEVRLTGDPDASAQIVLLGNWLYPEPETTVEGASAVTGTITQAEGGNLEAVSANGTRYRLVVPPRALVGLRQARVTLTPLSGVAPLLPPLAFQGGVRLEPHGLRFAIPATLVVEPPSGGDPDVHLGIRYTGLDRHYQFLGARPDTAQPERLRLALSGFSDVVVGSGVLRACESSAYPSGPVARYKSELACIDHLLEARQKVDRSATISEEELERKKARFLGWFNELVLPWINTANSPEEVQAATAAYLDWWISVQKHGLADALGSEITSAQAAIDGAISRVLATLDDQCGEEKDECKKMQLYNQIVEFLKVAQLLGEDYGGADLPDASTFCGNLPDSVVTTVELTPSATEVEVGQAITVGVTLLGKAGVLPGTSFTWSTSLGGNIDVVQTGDHELTVTGVAEGWAVLVVAAGCEAVQGAIAIKVGEPEELDLTGSWSFDITDDARACGEGIVSYSMVASVLHLDTWIAMGPLYGTIDGVLIVVQGAYPDGTGTTTSLLTAAASADGNGITGGGSWTWWHPTEPWACAGTSTFAAVRISG